MRGISPRALLLGLLVGAVVFGAYWLVDTPDGERPELQSRIAAAANVAGDGGIVDLVSAADFPWDRLHLIGPYTPMM